MAEEQKKGFFGRAIDALTSRDEKEAAEKAQQAAETAKSEAAVAQARAQEAERKIAEADTKAKQLEEELKLKESQEKARKLLEEMRERDAQLAAAAAPKFMAEYEVKGWDETLSHVALKYYNNATRPYWMLIYEANKEVVGDNPNIIKPGMVLRIPELPADMK